MIKILRNLEISSTNLVIFTILFFLLLIFLLTVFYQRKKVKQLMVENAILRIMQKSDDLTMDDIFSIYCDIRKYKKHFLADFSQKSLEILSENILRQEDFLDVMKFFSNWSYFKYDEGMIILHQRLVERTRDYVRSLAKKYFESLANEDPLIKVKKFKSAIDKPYFNNGYELNAHFYREIDEILTLYKKINPYKN